MGLTRWLGRLASGADIPVFAVTAAGGRLIGEEVALLPGVRVVDSPREANILLVVGRVTAPLLGPLLRVHDQLPAPRATVWWPLEPDGDGLRSAIPGLVAGRPGDGDGLRRVFAELLSGARGSEPPVLPDEEPAEWRGVGPYGQGGTGMTGGVPYGRPLPARAPDPDGLELDQLPLRVGPFFPPLPPGLVLDIGLQGDVVRQATVGDNPFLSGPGDPSAGPEDLDTAAFFHAVASPRNVAELETARARHHLRWVARSLRLHGLDARGLHVLALSRSLTPARRPAVMALAGELGRSRSLAAALRGIAPVTGHDACGGPTARAAGVAVDARLEDPAYRGLGFSPVVHAGGDALARLLQRLAEAVQALDLAERAGDLVRRPGPPLEGPRGPLVAGAPGPSAALLGLLPRLLVGQEWGDAMTTVASLDIDMEEAAAGRPAAAPA